MAYETGYQLADGELDKRRKKSAIRRKAITFTKIVSLVGIRHATDSKNSSRRRFIWVVWLVFGFGFAIYQIQERVDNYLQYPTVTEVQIINNETMLLPQVTVCNENEIMMSKAKKTKYYDYKNNMEAKMKQLEEAKKELNFSAIEEADKELNLGMEQFHNLAQDWENFSKNLSQTAEQAIVKVIFNEESNRGLLEEVVTDLGHCFAFSTKNKPLYSTKGGPSSGLILVLSVSRQEYETDSKVEPGFRMLIHDSDEIPRMNEGGLPLKPGQITRVVVSLEDVQQHGPPYSKCNAGDPDYKLANCLAKYDYDTFIKQCQCRTMDMEKSENVSICSYADYFNCTVVNKDLFLNASSGDDDVACMPQCRSRIYKTTPTYSAFPMLMNEASKNIPGDAQILDRIRVHVYYEEMSYMEMKKEPKYPFLELLCDIGGALSLLLGATLLTVYEAGEFLVLFARDYLSMRFTK